METDRTASFHNFKSQNFKLSVSNPKNKHVAYVSVLYQISNCQGLGRKNKLEIMKTYRITTTTTATTTATSIYKQYNDSNRNSNSHNSNTGVG